MNEQVTEKKMTFWKKLSYAMANFGGNVGYMLVTSYFLYYCTDSLGLSATVIGTLIAISKVLDGITDVIMGHIINITHSKLGKARFWIITSAFPFALLTFLIFYMPAFVHGTGSYVYLFIMYTLESAVAYTMMTIAVTTLLAYATTNAKDRYSMMTYSSVIGILPALILAFLTTTMVETFGGGQRGWMITAGLCSVVSFATILWTGLVIKELPQEVLNKGKNLDRHLGFGRSAKALVENKYFWLILASYLVIYCYSGIQGAVGIYYCDYILNNPNAFGFVYVAMYLPLVVMIEFVPAIVNKFGARKTNVIGALISIAAGMIVFINTRSMVVVFISLLLGTIGMLPSYVTINPLIAEASEYTKRRRNVDITPMLYSCSSVGIKVGAGIGTALTGFILSATGYDGMAVEQTARALNGIVYAFVLAPLVGYILLAVIYHFLDVEDVNKREQDEMEAPTVADS